MQEFESISASSYDPSALATKLTAKAAEGWKVVAIVPTGGDVTAYVSRESDAAAEPNEAVEVVENEAVEVEPVAADEETPEPEPEKIEEESQPAVSEPSGWAIAPEPAAPASEPSVPAAAVIPSYQPTITPTPATSPSAMGPSAVSPAAAAPAASVAPAAPTPAVPAGWYADPAGRFELRYWDGTTWTEHVSRTGQQFTDPPVA
jgi:Protein of unknown function (DUF2510)